VSQILVVEDEVSMRQFLQILLKRDGHDVTLASSGEEALQLVSHQEFDLVLTDLRMGAVGGLDVLQKTKDLAPETQVVVMTAYASTETAIQAMKEGAYDYVTKPFQVDALKETVRKALEKRALLVENLALRRQVKGALASRNLIGASPAFRKVFELIEKVAPTRSNILILGESGTGKELVARAIHERSQRGERAMVALNCGAIPANLIESELFGHVKGSFTGAVSSKRGYFELASTSTLFLDEIGELPMALQVKLLRVLQERRIKPLGASKDKPVDVRLICATNRDLDAEVKANRFREDLYYRINVIQIRIPALRERVEDIPALATYFIERYCRENGRAPLHITQRALDALVRYDYPGNVRELENIVERAVALAGRGPLDVDLLPEEVVGRRRQRPSSSAPEIPEEGLDLDTIVGELERELLVQALRRTKGVRKEAARLLGITFRSIRYRLDKYGIDEAEVERIALSGVEG